MSTKKRIWEREGGAPSVVNKGRLSNLLREAFEPLLVEAQQGKCVLCGEDLQDGGWDKDHVEPWCKSQNDGVLNLRLAHPRCNRNRGNVGLTPEQRQRVDISGARLEALLIAALSEERVEFYRRQRRDLSKLTYGPQGWQQKDGT